MRFSAADEHKMMYDWLQAWAADRKLIFESRGEVGFGRPCVGLTDGHSYVDLGPEEEFDSGHGDPIRFPTRLDDASAPLDVNAYHKTECLAVLVEDEDYEAAIEQLFRWVQKIDAAELVVKQEPRHHRNTIEALMHGPIRTFLSLPEEDE